MVDGHPWDHSLCACEERLESLAVRRREAAIVELVESVDEVRFLFAGAGEDVHDW